MITLNDVKKKNIIALVFTMILFIAFFTVCTDIVQAASSTDISLLKKLRSYNIDSVSNIGLDMLRSIGFALIKGLGDMMDSLYDMIGTVYKYLSFTTSDQLMKLLGRYSGLYKAIFIVSLTFFGIYIIHAKGKTDQLNTVNCILIIIFVVAGMPFFAQKMTKLTVASADYAKAQWTHTADSIEIESIASSIMTSNLVDLKKVDENISGSSINGLEKNKSFNDLRNGTSDWKMIDINETMDYGDNKLKSDIWSSRLQMEDTDEYELSDMSDGLINTYYYRYQIVSWFNIFAELISAAIVLFLVVLKCAMLVFQIAMSMVYTPFVVLTDLTMGQRSKEVIKNIVVLYATIFMCVALIGVYFTAFGFINEKVTQVFPKVIMHIALAWVTIDGPDVIERITGVDVGGKSAWQKAMGARAIMGMAHSAGSMAKKGVQTAGKVGRGAGNVIFGKSTIDQAQDKMREAKNNVVQEATDGKGILGFGKNTADAMRDKFTPADSTKGVENAAKQADKEFGQNLNSRGNKVDVAEKMKAAETAKPNNKGEQVSSGVKKQTPAQDKQKAGSAPSKPGTEKNNLNKGTNVNKNASNPLINNAPDKTGPAKPQNRPPVSNAAPKTTPPKNTPTPGGVSKPQNGMKNIPNIKNKGDK